MAKSRLNSYFKGNGKKVMADFQSRYGKKNGKRNFYATVNQDRVHGTSKQKAAQPKTAPGAKR